MYLRSLTLALLASTSLTTISYAQTAPAPVADPSAAQAKPATPATTPAPAAKSTPKSSVAAAPTTNIGEIQAKQAPKERAFSQTGLTSSPTDFAEVQNKANAAKASGPQTQGLGIGSGPARGVTPGGVTGLDLGGGYMIEEQAKKTRSTVTRDAIDKQAPASNPYQMINLLPGVVQSSVDDTGLNGGNIRMRGFNSDHIGFTIEGAPVNDSGNYALYPQEFVDAENIEQISIAQGSPDLDSPHIGAPGGVINLFMRDPSKYAGGLVDLSFGSDNLYREFVRVESGQVGAFRGYVSYSRLDKDHWTGLGTDERQHWDFKGVWDIDKDNTIRFTALYNDALNTFYGTPNLAEFQSGKAAGNSPNNTPFNSNFVEYRVNPFRNLILSAPSNFKVADKLRFDTIPYYWYGYGNGGGVSTLSESGFSTGNIRVENADLNGDGDTTDSIVFYTPSVTETHRPGVINKFTYELGDHKLVAGHWFEWAHHRQTGPLEALAPNGSLPDPFANADNTYFPGSTNAYFGATCTIANGAASGSGSATGTPVACPNDIQKRNVLTLTKTNMLFLGDTWKATNWLTFDFGVKHVIIDRDTESYVPDAKPPIDSLHDEVTLPTAGVTVQLDRDNQVFGSVTTTFRSAPNYTVYPEYTLGGGYTPVDVPDPEKGINYEIGHRYHGDLFATSVSLFYGDYDDFQQTTRATDPDTGGAVSVTKNVGGLRNYGINAEFGTRPIYHFRPYVSAELMRAEMRDNLRTLDSNGNVDYLPTAGKELPGAPNYSFGLGLDYDDGHVFGNLAYKYISAQYSTLMNDEEMDAFGRLNASIGYRFADLAYLKQPEIKLNLFNVTNEKQLVGIFSQQNNAKDTTGVNGGTIKASGTPSYYLGQDFSAMVTLRAGF